MKCLAYTRAEAFEDSWLPCAETAIDDGLCQRHRDAITGIMIGALVNGEINQQERENAKDNSRLSSRSRREP